MFYIMNMSVYSAMEAIMQVIVVLSWVLKGKYLKVIVVILVFILFS